MLDCCEAGLTNEQGLYSLPYLFLCHLWNYESNHVEADLMIQAGGNSNQLSFVHRPDEPILVENYCDSQKNWVI